MLNWRWSRNDANMKYYCFCYKNWKTIIISFMMDSICRKIGALQFGLTMSINQICQNPKDYCTVLCTPNWLISLQKRTMHSWWISIYKKYYFLSTVNCSWGQDIKKKNYNFTMTQNEFVICNWYSLLKYKLSVHALFMFV